MATVQKSARNLEVGDTIAFTSLPEAKVVRIELRLGLVWVWVDLRDALDHSEAAADLVFNHGDPVKVVA